MRHRVSWGWFVLAVFLLIGSVALLGAVSVGREAARQSACHGQMYFLYHALLDYHSANGHFPAAYVEGPDGTPWHSWRVLLLPYLEEGDAYSQYNFDEPWNGPHNRKLADKIYVDLFQCPSGNDRDQNHVTNYCVVVGDTTAFPGNVTSSMPNLIETTSKAIMLVEVENSDIHWMEPRDLAMENLVPETGARFGSPHARGVGVVRADGTYERLNETSIQSLVEQLHVSDNGSKSVVPFAK